MIKKEQFSKHSLQQSELESVVAKIIDDHRIDTLDWTVHDVTGVGGSKQGGSIGLFRLIGSAKANGQAHSWSVIVKVFGQTDTSKGPLDTSDTPSDWNYWKREILAYRSKLVTELSGNLVAPRCYGITEHPNDEWHIWLEDIQETSKNWTLDCHGTAARHLGQFNGAYLDYQFLPKEEPWMFRGRVRHWPALAAPAFDGFQRYALSPPGQRWLQPQNVDLMQQLLSNQNRLVAQLDTLPICLCHHDGFRGNLLSRHREDTGPQTVAIDWSMFGYGGIGEEAGITTALGLTWLAVPGTQAREMDQMIFESYVDGLRDTGWKGDVRLVRFGYTATASLVVGVAFTTFMGIGALASAEGIRAMESAIGYEMKDILEQWAITQPFLIGLGKEALQLSERL